MKLSLLLCLGLLCAVRGFGAVPVQTSVTGTAKTSGTIAKAPPTLKEIVNQTTLPKVELSDVSLGTAIEWWKQQASKQAGQPINVVVTVPKTDTDSRHVTLSLGQIPAGEVLRYICDQAGVRFRVEEYAVQIKP